MNFRGIKEKISGFNLIPTENLYIALIGHIDADVVSDDNYINKGEYYSHYTAVTRNKKFTDIYDNKSYNFRDERDDYTILQMSKYPTAKPFVKANILKQELEDCNKYLEDIKYKSGDNKSYIRTKN